ncbi:MAG: replication initiation protein [Propionibacteriales bacterium]|nr:replication initiation protein [Propionibacteriales bacterium]
MSTALDSAKVDPRLIRETAIAHGVCVRPIIQELYDTKTGQVRLVPIPCGFTKQNKCPPCADAARRLRMQQCREGWHLEEEPVPVEEPDDDSEGADDENDPCADDGEQADDQASRRVRSTRRRQDVPDLPKVEQTNTTLGRTFEAADGKTYRPSMFLTLTLDSYGRVRPDGTPVDPDSYDYRRAALDALHFGKLVDRFWQNLRRCAGYKVQYFATVEPQKRRAPHLHAAVRGVIPREVVRQVVEATYHQLWWPRHDAPVFPEGGPMPRWDPTLRQYVMPDTGRPLATWERALKRIDGDPYAEPAHVLRFGVQMDYQGILAGSADRDRRIGYLTKYLTKTIAGERKELTRRQREHAERLHEEIRWLPCSPECSNWLRYGVQPKNPVAGMKPGQCPKRAHELDNLGYGGRRVLVSRKWTGKTLADHKADRTEVVRQALAAAGIEMEDVDRYSATATDDDGKPRYIWSPLDPKDTDPPTYKQIILTAIADKQRWRAQYEQAKAQAGCDPGNYSATEAAREHGEGAMGHG